MDLELWQSVCLLWIVLCVAGAVAVSYGDLVRDRLARRVVLRRLEDGALTEVPAPRDQLLNAGGPCRCSSCTYGQVKW